MAGMQAEQERQQFPRTPASAAGCGGAAHAGPAAGPTLRRRALDLRRLLHAMRTSTAPAAECESVQTQLLPSHVLADRLALSQSLLSHLHHAVAQSRQGRAGHLHHLAVLAEGERRSADYDELERARREHLDQCVREDGLVQALAAEAEEVGRLVREDLLEARRREGAYGTSNGDDKGDALERDIIDELFLSPEEEEDDGGDTDVHDMHSDAADDYSLGLSDDGNDQQQQQQQQQPQPAHGQTRPKQHHNHNTTTNSRTTDEQNEEVKRQQAEMLESEIAEMAAQMKSATLRMNTTLREQSSALDDMEQTVTENLDQVTDVTTKVTDHVSRGWRKTAATWTLLFTVVGTFAFLFMTMRVAPKRRDACIFFCSGDSRYETKWNQAEEERKRLLEELRLRDENDAVDAAAAAATTAEQIAAEEKAARERKLEEERLRREEEAVAAEAQARADRIKEEENQKKADRERAERERERIASENKAAQQEAATNGISEQDFRFAAGGRGHLEDVVSFIDRHPDKVNAPDANRWTALHEAARAGNTEIIQVLLGAGADVALTTKSGQNALQLLEGTHGPTHSAAFILRQGNLKSKEEEKNIARSEL